MQYPEYMTKEDIEQFEYEINKIIDTERGEGQFWAENAELQVVAHDALERDWNEPYEPETNDDWYDEQYEVDYSDF